MPLFIVNAIQRRPSVESAVTDVLPATLLQLLLLLLMRLLDQ